MNKKFSISKTGIYLALLLIALIAYVFLYFLPAQTQMNMLRADIALFNAETAIYRQYLADPTPLEADIEAIQAEIDRMHAEDYTNDSTVSFEIGNAVQRHKVSLTAVSVGNPTTMGTYQALPINLTLSGELENLLKFIRYFENDEDGSYVVTSTTFEMAGTTVNASIVLHLCTPNV